MSNYIERIDLSENIFSQRLTICCKQLPCYLKLLKNCVLNGGKWE